MILVTGATGAIGAMTVKALKASGAKFKVGVRSLDKAQAMGAEGVAFDWDKPETYLSAFQGVEKLFFLTPVSNQALGYTLDAMAAAKRAGVKHIVKLSVAGAESVPGISLGRQHRATEDEIKYSGIAWTMLQPTFFMQNFVNYYGVNPKADSTVYLPHGSQKVGWVDAQDIGDMAAKVLTSAGHEGKSYVLTGPTAHSSAEALAVLGETLGHKYTYVDVPEDAARKAMEDMKMPLWLVDGFMELHSLIKAGWASATSEDIKKVLGREARSFHQYAKELAASVK